MCLYLETIAYVFVTLIYSSERQAQAALKPVYERRREIVKSIPGFWPNALIRHSLFAYHAQHNADQSALNFLEDLWVEKDPNEHRCFTIEFVSNHGVDISTKTETTYSSTSKKISSSTT